MADAYPMEQLGAGQPVVKPKMAQRRILKGHFGKIYSMSWGPDNKRIVSASQDGKLIIWNAFTTNKEQAIALKSSWVMTCAYSQCGKYVAAGGLDNIVTVYQLGEAKGALSEARPLAELSQHEGYLSCCRFLGGGENTPSDSILSSSGDSSCILWDLNKKAPKSVFTAHGSDVMCVSVCPVNEKIFVSGSCDATAKVWDMRQNGKEAAQTLAGHESDINSVAFMSTGTAFASGSDDSSCGLFDLRAGAQIHRYASNKILCGVTSVTFSKSGRLLFSSYDESIVHVWDTISGNKCAELDGHEERVSCVSVSRDGKALCTASWDTTMKIWA